LDEPTLIRLAVNGDATAWEPLVLAHQQAVFRLAYLLLGDPDEAEDVAQETFLRAWRALKGFDSTRPLRPWLLSIAANLSRNRYRSAGR
jgi:RNA polymerase sigma-70 factor (ECF subfamily)